MIEEAEKQHSLGYKQGVAHILKGVENIVREREDYSQNDTPYGLGAMAGMKHVRTIVKMFLRELNENN